MARNYLPIPRRELMRLRLQNTEKSVPKKSKTLQNKSDADARRREKPSLPRSTAKKKTGAEKAVPGDKKSASDRRRKMGRSLSTAKASTASMLDPSHEEIRIRAYFISERRYRLGLPGDSNSDWIEARRQLLSESGPR